LAAESAQHNRTIRKLIAFHNQGKKIGKEPCHQEIRAEQRWNRAKLPGNPGGMTMEQSRWNGKQDSTEVQVSKDMLTLFAAIHCLRGGTSGTDLRGNLFSLPSPRGQMQSTPESVTGT
jgi:hypothetical protein